MYEKYLNVFYKELPLDECFDLLERKLVIGGRRAVCFFVNGLTDSELMQRVMEYFMKVRPCDMEDVHTSEQFVASHMPFLDASLTEPKTGPIKEPKSEQGTEQASAEDKSQAAEPWRWSQKQISDCCSQAMTQLYAGLVPLMVEGLDKIIVMDVRSYPLRSVEEPQKEKSLRGAKDGFTEGFMQNIALIRRRLRDNRLIFKNFTIGTLSKTDVAIGYIKGEADDMLVERICRQLQTLADDTQLDTLTVGDQSLLEKILLSEKKVRGAGLLNPFPKVRYSQRPDIISAHISEGKIALIVDNSPTVMLVPVGIFDFLQDVDDYYFPKLTGNYFRILRTLNFIVILLLTPVYMVIVENESLRPEILSFFVPNEDFAIPLFWQFILLEIAVDALKLASLNTPESLGMSLSVIGALILGQFSIDSGWFIPQTILCMAVVALAGFTQPSIELSYSIKFTRMLLLIGAYLLGIWGIVLGAAVSFTVMASTKTLSGDSYLYPLIPFHWNALKRLLFRTSM